MGERQLPGRGTTANPPNRFETMHLELEPDPDAFPEEGDTPPSPTVLYRDTSRSVLAENQSPDVGFRFSLNPYRGCEHGCVYCLGPETPILYADLVWRPIGEARVGDELAAFDEFPAPGRARRLRKATIEAVLWSRRPTKRLVTDRAEVLTTAEHRWLPDGTTRWSETTELRPGRKLRHLPVVTAVDVDDDYRLGYVAGVTLGGARARPAPTSASDPLGFPAARWRVALPDEEPLARLVEHLRRFGVEAHVRPCSDSREHLSEVEVRSLGKLAAVRSLVDTERDSGSYRRGFLAGFFDAEGRPAGARRAPAHGTVLERVRRYAASLGFGFLLEPRRARLADAVRFLSLCRPAITLGLQAIFGRTMRLDPAPVRAVEPGPLADVVDIQTSTGTFYAAGLATHNCYARPSHEYLGWSAGLDFERRILVKEDAPALLRAELGARGWEPQVVALSGNTDCYQPAERRLELTRRCLEVFAEFRNPVAAITKSALVARDADLYAALARHGAAHVFVSVTTLDPDLARRMEPRAARPERRLEAIRTLAAAGVPVGVMIGPVIPGLNDAEIPRILERAAAAGASSASWVLLRLPRPVDALFDAWLAEHYPERRTRVLHRIQDTRGGRLSDSTFHRRQRGEGEYAAQIAALFAAAARKHGLDRKPGGLDASAFRRPAAAGDQLRLW